MSPGTVTATQSGSTSPGIATWVGVLTGQNAVQPGNKNGVTQATNNQTITPNNTGSWIYGVLLALANGGYTALTGTTIKQNVGGGGLQFIAVRDTAKGVSGTPETIGVSQANNGISNCMCEIVAGPGLNEDASTPGGSGFASAFTVTSPAFTPPPGSELVILVSSNGGGAVTSMIITDSLSLTWTEQVKQNTAGDGYTGIWTAKVPVKGSGLLMASMP